MKAKTVWVRYSDLTNTLEFSHCISLGTVAFNYWGDVRWVNVYGKLLSEVNLHGAKSKIIGDSDE